MESLNFNKEDFQHPADGWYQIEALGNHTNRAAGVLQVIDQAAAKAIVTKFNSDAAAGRLRHGSEMLIDHEHFKHDETQETRAYGWLQELQNRDDGIYGRIRWTTTGQAAVDGGDYRFFSTEYDPESQKVLNDGNPKRVRPLQLDGLSLTNMNNNLGQKPITNRQKTGNFDTEAEYEAAKQENQRHVQANKDAAAKVEAQRKADTEAEQSEFAQPALEKFCRAVKSVHEAAGKAGHQMLSMPAAFAYAKAKFPDLYAAAFAPFSDDDLDDPENAVNAVTHIANRIGKLAGRNFDFGWQFVRTELPMVFNRMTSRSGRVMNRVAHRVEQLTTPNAARVFDRLMRAEMAINSLPENAAHTAVRNRHPGLYGVASGRMMPSDALRLEPGFLALLL